jgi:hypothetical protein
MGTPNRQLVQIYGSSGDSDVANTNEIDLGPYVNAGKRQITGVWVNYDLGAATDTTSWVRCWLRASIRSFNLRSGGRATAVISPRNRPPEKGSACRKPSPS